MTPAHSDLAAPATRDDDGLPESPTMRADPGGVPLEEALDETAEVIAAAVEEMELGVTDADLALEGRPRDPDDEADEPASFDLGELVDEASAHERHDEHGNTGEAAVEATAHRVPEIPDVSLRVAAELESIAHRLRAGELRIPEDQRPSGAAAALALVLSALLGNRI